MRKIIVATVVGLAGLVGYVIGETNGTAKASKNAPALAKARKKARDDESNRQQRPGRTTAANLLALQRMTKRSRKKDAKRAKSQTKQ